MAKIIRLKGFEQRRWFSASSVITLGDGTARELTRRENDVVFQLARFVRDKRQSARAKVPGEASTIEARLEKIEGSTASEVRFYVDGSLVESVRDVMSRELLATHGECQIRMTNGKFLAAIRDPAKKRAAPGDVLRSAPRPESCICKDWGDPHPGRHHPICEFNLKAAPEERGEGSVHGNIEIMKPGAAKALPPAPPSPIEPRTPTVLPSPSECACKAWNKPEGSDPAEHHPICEWHDEWKNRERGGEVLASVASGKPVRAATADEIKAADENEQKNGSRIIDVDGESYAVVPA